MNLSCRCLRMIAVGDAGALNDGLKGPRASLGESSDSVDKDGKRLGKPRPLGGLGVSSVRERSSQSGINSVRLRLLPLGVSASRPWELAE